MRATRWTAVFSAMASLVMLTGGLSLSGCAGQDDAIFSASSRPGAEAAAGKGDSYISCDDILDESCPEGTVCRLEVEGDEAVASCVPAESDPTLDDLVTEPAAMVQWACLDQPRPHYYREYCISADVEWDPESGACSFQVYVSDKDRESLECDATTRRLWIESLDCVKWTTVTYDVVSSHRFLENGEENPWASVMIRVTGGVTASGNEFGPLFNYMEDPDYLGANFSHDLSCEPLALP